MSRNAGERWVFLFFGFVVLLFSASYVPTVYGNDPASIERYLAVHEGRRLGDHVEILAVEDVGENRFVVFRLETKRPDERYVVRFHRNEQGNYEGAGRYEWMDRMYSARVYKRPVHGGPDGQMVYYVIWNESEKLAQVRFQLNWGNVESIRIPPAPSMTVWEFRSTSGWHLETWYFAADGSEL